MSKHSDILAPLLLGERDMKVENNSGAPMCKRMKGDSRDSAQLSLFDIATARDALATDTPPQKSRTLRRQIKNDRPAHKAQSDTVRLVTLEDMPSYPADAMEMVDNSIASLPGEAVWLTYRDIGKHFGISRATIARRLKDSLVPGVRFQHQRMLDDGPVRRFDLVQLRWLLLAVRARGAR